MQSCALLTGRQNEDTMEQMEQRYKSVPLSTVRQCISMVANKPQRKESSSLTKKCLFSTRGKNEILGQREKENWKFQSKKKFQNRLGKNYLINWNLLQATYFTEKKKKIKKKAFVSPFGLHSRTC